LIDLVDMRGGSELVAADLVSYPGSSWEAILADRRSWLIPATMWFHVTQEGITYLQTQRRIY
jgi:hypothetical protein